MAKGKALDKCEKIPLAKATAEPDKEGSYDLLANRYWQVVDDCILLYMGFAPQCNSNQSIAERLAGGVGEVKFLPRVWLEHACEPSD